MGRPKKEKDDKKKIVNLSINPDVLEKIDEYLKENNLTRSKFIEKMWKEHLDKK